MGLNYLLSPEGFLKLGGVVLVLVAVLGFIGLIGPTDESLFGSYWYFDDAENWAHLVIGIVALIAVFSFPAKLQKGLSAAVGVFAILVALYSLFGAVPEGTTLLGAALQNPTDTLLHIVVGVWGMAAGFKKSSMSV